MMPTALPAPKIDTVLPECEDTASLEKTKPRQALTSSASAEWGTGELVRRFAACVLRPAAIADQAIDLDAMSSAYWQAQWAPADRPRGFFDGSPGRDIFSIDDWEAEIKRLSIGKLDVRIGSAFCNPAGDASGTVIQDAWYALNDLHRAKKIGSFFWVGFNLEQLRSLIPDDAETARDALNPLDARVCTVMPSKRISYMVHPDAMIKLVKIKISRYTAALSGSSELARLNRQLEILNTRSDDSPVVGSAPTHASYLTIVWHHESTIRRRQQRAAKDFLRGQRDLPKSALVRAMAIGDVG